MESHVIEKKSLLVVGGTGVISYAVVCEAVKQGFLVTCINRGKSKNQKLPDEVEVLIADYRNRDQIESLLRNRFFDSVIDVLCYSEKDIDYSVSLFNKKCNQYIFFSSCAVYNKGRGDYVCTEESELVNPVWDYSVNKVRCEKKLIELAKKLCFNYTIVRPAVTYGNTRIPYGITPPYGYHGTLIQRILHEKPIILWDEGETYSTITHVNDFAYGLVGLLENKNAYNQAFHIVGDEKYKWKEVVEILGDILGKKPILFSITKEELAQEMPLRRGEILGGRGINQFLDNSKMKKNVPNFGTKISLVEGMKKTVEYYQKNNYLSGIDYTFDACWDRIIRKYTPRDNRKIPNLKFFDYLGSATRKDRIRYFVELHKENFFVKLYLLLSKYIKKVLK